MNISTIDIGSNTSLLLIAQINKKAGVKKIKVLEDKIFFTRLAEKLSQTKLISSKALARQQQFFKTARRLLNKHKVKKVICAGTAAVRSAKNTHKLKALAKEQGFLLKTLSAKQEGRLSRLGALLDLPQPSTQSVVLDIGGASTEISTSQKSLSLPIGSVRLTEQFLPSDPPTAQEILKLKTYIKQCLQKNWPAAFCHNFKYLVAVAGTPTTLTALEKKQTDIKKIHGQKLNKVQVNKWLKFLLKSSLEQRKALKEMPVYRADVLPAGLLVLKEIMDHFRFTKCVVSTTGLRYGLLLSL